MNYAIEITDNKIMNKVKEQMKKDASLPPKINCVINEEQIDEMESITEMEDRLQQETRKLQDFKKNIDTRPIYKQQKGNEGTSFRRNKEQNKERISTPHPSACKVCGTPTGKIYSYQCSKCKSPL